MKLKFNLLALLFVFASFSSFSQMSVVVMGSSTAYGVGASTYQNSWVGKTEAYLNRNADDGRDTVVHNIAFPGYDSYQEMPTGFVPPAGRPMPDVDFNVTKALSFNPDVVIINLPSNDISYGYSKREFINNLRTMSAAIFANGNTRCYVTTPQPRNDFTAAERDSLFSMIDSVNLSFGPYAIDFWSGLVIPDGTHTLREEFRAAPSPLHVNDLGHNVLFEKIRDSYIFGLAGPVALQLTNFTAQAQSTKILLNWHIEQQPSNTIFDIQRSVDGRTFETFATQSIVEARTASNYSTLDANPFAGTTFYRIRITEASGREVYSNVININAPGKSLSIGNIYADNSGSNIRVAVNVQKTQPVNVQIIGAAGNVLYKQKYTVSQPGTTLTIPVGRFSAGQYYIRVTTADGGTAVKAFNK